MPELFKTNEIVNPPTSMEDKIKATNEMLLKEAIKRGYLNEEASEKDLTKKLREQIAGDMAAAIKENILKRKEAKKKPEELHKKIMEKYTKPDN